MAKKPRAGAQTPSKALGEKTVPPEKAAPATPWQTALLGFLESRSTLLAFVLVLVGSLRIVSTYDVFSHTADELGHMASGMEWLEKGKYTLEHQHPPLARVMTALPLYLDGSRLTGQQDLFMEGISILAQGGQYERKLTLERAGILPFFWIASLFVFLWSKRVLGSAGAVVSLAAFTSLPIVLAHAGLATTDMALAATFTALLYASLRFAELPNWRTGACLGVAGSMALLSKFTAMLFYPVAIISAIAAWWIAERPTVSRARAALRSMAGPLALAAVVGFLVVWAAYRFSFGKAPNMPFVTPFPELFSGIADIRAHHGEGHASYFLGELRIDGWFAFFPVLIAVKTPLGALALVAIGLFRGPGGAGPWGKSLAIGIVAGLLAVVIPSRINIGLRHLLPIYSVLPIIAASAVLWLLDAARTRRWAAPATIVLFGWFVGSVAINHPDYLAYFNELAGSEPERIVVDSDLDWGQDHKRLAKRLREVGATSLAFTPPSITSPQLLELPPMEPSHPFTPSPGWNAVSLTQWKTYEMGRWSAESKRTNRKTWPDLVKPRERVGRGILLYYFPPSTVPQP